ncbi:GNAT family N-acetyltransferase [Clostridium sp. KNHs205]|jgi:ribosomal protein S18 acetylase RimI-like enzyme|uniref:GNAT family N-acetyltransferase n=1 Tax=Clostridium sp. KNHs205 TaxID=1449050 RepID=UPI00068C1D64|nr:GNAT family N-acetyltransferase [Clostridium sp. KNHs205]
MCKVIFQSIKSNELAIVSKQISNSYKVAYKGLMNEEYLLTLTDEHWIDILQNSISRGDSCLVAKDNDKIIGTAVFGKTDGGVSSENAILHAIYLTPQYIGYGVGHGLYTEVEKAMKVKNYKYCILEVLSSNNHAIDFYLKHGFKKTGDFRVEENGMILQCDTMQKCII